MHYGPRDQARVLSHLIDRVEYYNSINFPVPFDTLFTECANECDVSKATARRYWLHFELYGELTHETATFMKKMRRKYGWLPESAKINTAELAILKQIVDNRPDLFLDEIAVVFGVQTGKFFHHTTLWRYITNHLNYSLQSLTERAAQQCEATRAEFKYTLDLVLHEKPELLVLVDETHRDRNASRRRRGYGRKNNGGLKMEKWFKDIVRYTMIGVADVNGFIPSACKTFLRDEISEEGAAGTVTRDVFEEWVKEYLCPILGDYSKGQNRSIVMLDNASTHMSRRVVDMIERTGAKVLYTAPFSPDLNPIENFFSVYKSFLKKHNDEMIENWEAVHLQALASVDREMGIKYYRRCGIPGSKKMRTKEETTSLNNEVAIFIIIILIIQSLN